MGFDGNTNLKPTKLVIHNSAKLKPSVGFASTDWSYFGEDLYPNGCTWYRAVLPSRQLMIRGGYSKVGILGATQKGYLGICSPNNEHETELLVYRIIVLKLVMMQAVLDLIPTAQKLGQKIVVDIDDMFDELHPTNNAFASTDSTKFPNNNRIIHNKIIEASDALITSTNFLYDHYSSKYPGKPIFLVKNGIDLLRWKKQPIHRRAPQIGWLGAVPWRSLDLEQISGFIGDFISKNKLKFHHSGFIPNTPKAQDILNIDSSRCSESPMVSIYDLPNAYSQFDIGIVPLNNIPFNKAKSFIKGLEYVAAGIPFVASDIGEYSKLAKLGVGRVAKTKDEWIGHLDALMDYKTREDDANKNYEIVRKMLTIDNRGEEWSKIFSKIDLMR